ncbi:hypothetical protein [Actinomadura soli]|uniref:hypothetical protein n=1 Tax=Actinomadura soli TaxID=2508997 RepID=UPI00197ACA45|nr:hypothetical protein [Actinomadura soli]
MPSIDGVALPGQRIAILDLPSLALATGAGEVHFDFAVGASAGRRRGEPASTEVLIDLKGNGPSGDPLRIRRHLFHPAGQRPLTALGVERPLGLRGEPACPGLHTPEALLDPALTVERMTAIGTTFATV